MTQSDAVSEFVRDDVIESVAAQSRPGDAVLDDEIGFDDRGERFAAERMRSAGERAADGERCAAVRRE